MASTSDNIELALSVDKTALNFFYQLGSTDEPEEQNISFYLEGLDCSNVQYEVEIVYLDGYDWVNNTLYATDYAGDVNVGVDVSGFTAGIYQAKIRIKAYCGDTPESEFIVESDYISINLQIEENDYLNVSSDSISFSHQLGTDLPNQVTVDIITNLSWTATSSSNIVEASPSSGDGNGSISIGLSNDVDTLSAGDYNYQITVTAGELTQIINVSVSITDSSGLEVSPDQIDFEFLLGSNVYPSAQLHIFTSDDWAATPSSNVINLSATSGTGSAVVDVGINNIESIPSGNYTFSIEIQSAGEVKTVTVTLSIFDFLSSDLQEGSLSFTKNRDFINITSNRDDTYIEMKFIMTVGNWDGTEKQFEKIYNLPLFKREAVFHPGMVVNDFFAKEFIDHYDDENIYPLFKSLRLDLFIKEISLITGDSFFYTELRNVNFVSGFKNDIKKANILTKNISFKRINSDNRIYISSISNISNDFFTIIYENLDRDTNGSFISVNYVKLHNLNVLNLSIGEKLLLVLHSDLLPPLNWRDGDIIEIISYIKLPAYYSTFIWFINNYGALERFEFTGKTKRRSELNRLSNNISDYTYEKEITALVETDEFFTINTGWILPEELAELQDLLNSKKVWIEIEGNFVEVIPQTKKLNLTADYKKLHNFNIDFKLNTNTDDQIYL